MPYTYDFTDTLDINIRQKEKLAQLNWESYVLMLDDSEFMRRQLDIIPNSEGYLYMSFSGDMCKINKLKQKP